MAVTDITTTQTIWRWLGSPAYPPPAAKRGQPHFGTHPRCWLCGGESGAEPWPRATWLAPTFTNHTLAACPPSDTICQPCAYLGSGDSWREYCAAHPEMGLKSVHPLSWRTYSHVFTPTQHACPGRTNWRQWLVEPPEPPFVLVLAESGQKHTVYRARVSASRDAYWTQLEEDTVLVTRADLTECISVFERLLAMGFTRDEIRTGRYSQGRLLKAGMPVMAIDAHMERWRRSHPDYVRIAAQAAHRPEEEA